MKKIIRFFRKDIVLSVSFCLAVLSCLIAPPSLQYLDYIDFKTLILLFCLMLIIEGLRGEGFFSYIGNRILTKVTTKRGIVLTLIFLCFVSSMFITNDVALITFVPFSILILEMAGMRPKLCLMVTLMTIAGNLGSMFSPIGNPQNLYLFSLSNMEIWDFFLLMLPYTAVSAVLLILFAFFGWRQAKLKVDLKIVPISNRGLVFFYLALFLLCVLAVAGLVPPVVLLIAVTVCLLWKNRKLFVQIDYSLLLTFLFFFVFVGNLKQVESLQQLIQNVLANHERMISVAVSQVISNVPAAMLLSSYTDQIKELIVGTNIGGLGTLIASMASLISYKQISNQYPQLKKKYFLTFTLCNLAFLIVLCIMP